MKPFRGTVLMAHLRAQLATHKRLTQTDTIHPQAEQGLYVGDLNIRPKARQVFLKGKEVPLTGKEFDLLFFLVQHPNEVFSKEQLFEKIWSFDPIGEPATVTVHINRLRDKLKMPPVIPMNASRPSGAPATVSIWTEDRFGCLVI